MPATRVRPAFPIALGIVVFLIGGTIARGQSTWQGGGTDTTWSTADNWSPALANGFNTGLVFQGSNGLTNTNDLTTGTATSITFNAGAGAFTIGGNALALTGSIGNNSSNLQSLSNNITLLANTMVTGTNVTLSGTVTNSGGNRTFTNGLGTGDLLTLGAINLSEGNTGRTLQLSGTGNTTINGAIANGGSGAGSFSIGGSGGNAYSGTVAFAGNSTYSGTTTFANNTLAVAIGSDQAFGTSVVNFNNNRVAASGGGAGATTDVTLANRVNIGTTFVFGGTSSIELAGPTYMMAGTNLSSAITGVGKQLTISGTFFLQDSGTAGRVVTIGPGIVISGDIKDSANGQGSSGLSLNGAGTYTLSGSNSYSGGTLIASNQTYTLDLGNKAALGTGSLTYGTGGLTIRALADLGGDNAISNAITMNATGNPLTVGGSNNIAFAGNLTGPGRLTITNTGITTISGTNSYAGATAVNGGTLVFGGTQAKAGGTVTAAAAGSIGLGVGGANSYTSADVAALFGNTLSGFSMNAASGVAVDTTGGNFTISDALAGSRAFTKLGPNTLTLSGNNSFGGTFTVSEGAVSVATINNASANGPLGNSAGAVLLGSSGKTGALEYTGTTASSTKPFTAVAGGTAAFSVTNAAAVLTLSGAIDGNGDKSFGGPGSYVITGEVSAGSVFKTGTGTLALANANSYGGDTSLNAGTLKLASGGSFANSPRIVVGDAGSAGAVLDLTEKSSFSIGASQTLMGGGSVNLGASTLLTVSGTFSPGNSPGLFTYSSGTTLLAGTTLMEILGTSRATSPSHGDGFYDAVNVMNGGVLDFGDSILTLSFDSLFNVGDTFQLFQALDTASLAGNFGSVNVTGTYYTNLTWTKSGSLWESTPAVGGESLSFNASTGLLSVAIAVPEPGSLALAGIGMAFTGWAVARRCRRVRGVTRP